VTIKQVKMYHNVPKIMLLATFNLYKFTLKSRSSSSALCRECITVNFHIFQSSFVWVREVLSIYRRRKRQMESTSQESLGVFRDILHKQTFKLLQSTTINFGQAHQLASFWTDVCKAHLEFVYESCSVICKHTV